MQTALNKPSSVVAPGVTIYLRGGTYVGKFSSTISGNATAPVTVRSYPGEWARLDGYLNAPLNSAISSSATTIVLTNASKIPEGTVVSIADQADPGSEEQILLNNKNGNQFTNCIRGWNGTAPKSHASGALAIIGGNQLTINGSYSVWRDLEITNSDPVRVQIPANSQNAPHLRGEGFFNLGAHNKFINCIIHNVQDGFFNNATAPEVYGCIIFNNGYVAGGRHNGHGLYLIHSNTANAAVIRDNQVFNNNNMGVKGDSQNGNAVNILSEGNILFNSGSWLQDTARNMNLLMASNNGIADAITVKDNYVWHTPGLNGSNIVLGLGDAINGTVTASGNVVGGGIPLVVNNWTRATVTGNTLYGVNNTGGGNSTVVLYIPAASSTMTWDNNSIINRITGQRGYYPTPVSSSSTFTQWKNSTGFDQHSAESTSLPATSASYVRRNTYDANQANIAVFNWSGGTFVPVNLSSVLSVGDTYAIYATENIFGPPVVTGTYNGGTVNVPMTSGAVAQPIGWNTTIASVRPSFGAFRLWKGTRAF